MVLLAAMVSALFSVSTPPTTLASISGFGGDDDKKVEVPLAPEIWKATVTDSTLTDTELDEFSVDGFTHIQGALGAGVISIKFEDISRIDFEPGEKGKSIALVVLKAGSTKKVMVDGKTPIYGKTGFGNFKVLVKDTKKIVFSAAPTKRDKGAGGSTVTPKQKAN
jgi:hypothetical protein